MTDREENLDKCEACEEELYSEQIIVTQGCGCICMSCINLLGVAS